MRLSPIILSWATASWLGPTGTTAAQSSNDYELSTEFFLVPGDVAMDRNGLASVASVISVPAPNRTVSVLKTPPKKEAEPDTRSYPRSLLRQRPWALPLAALSAATMLLMAGFEVFVLLKVGSFTFALSTYILRIQTDLPRSRSLAGGEHALYIFFSVLFLIKLANFDSLVRYLFSRMLGIVSWRLIRWLENGRFTTRLFRKWNETTWGKAGEEDVVVVLVASN